MRIETNACIRVTQSQFLTAEALRDVQPKLGYAGFKMRAADSTTQ